MSDETNGLDRYGLEAACEAMALHGLDFRVPWDGDLDDAERERFDALCAAIRAYNDGGRTP